MLRLNVPYLKPADLDHAVRKLLHDYAAWKKTDVVPPIDVDDIATLHGRLANGMYVTIEASKMVPGAADGLRVEAYGTAGSVFYDMDDVNAIRLGTAAVANSLQRVDVWNRSSPAATIPGSETATSSLSWHAASWEAFLATVAGESRLVCDGAGAVYVDAVIAAARRSATRDGAWEQVQ